MAMDPEVQQLLAAMAQDAGQASGSADLQQQRASYATVGARLGGAPPPMAQVTDLFALADQGQIPLRQYRPASLAAGLQPGLIYIHGGGWVMGDLDTHDIVCRRLAQACGCTVVAVDYRLAPEHPFPAGPDDVIAASRWIHANAEALGIDRACLGIVGDSAGGSLSAVACLAHRDQLDPPLCCQVLIYPGTDNTRQGSTRHSRIEQAGTPPLTGPEMQAMIDQYLPEEADTYDWRASPLLAKDHTRLPPALLITGGYDPLRDEGVAYAQALVDGGVEVLHRHFPGQIHGFIEMGGVLSAVEEAMQVIAFWFSRCHPAH